MFIPSCVKKLSDLLQINDVEISRKKKFNYIVLYKIMFYSCS
jgi:hypothetical protein